MLASAWLAVAIALAAHGLHRLWWRRRSLHLPELCLDAALLALPVGAVWLVLSRLGATPLGFREPIVLLTAVHFHYADPACGLREHWVPFFVMAWHPE